MTVNTAPVPVGSETVSVGVPEYPVPPLTTVTAENEPPVIVVPYPVPPLVTGTLTIPFS